jgi:phage-related tail protein
MRQSSNGIPLHFSKAHGIALAVLSALMLSGCQTDGAGIGATLTTAKPAEIKTNTVTHTEAAAQCWMSTEKGAASLSLDKRADVVNKCIDDKMKGAPVDPQS